MNRYFLLTIALITGSLTGCASTWDNITSRDFRKAPFKNTFVEEDPMTVLRTKIDGTARAKAMLRLQEPAANKGSATDQDEALQILANTATSDPSPILRTAAVDALGRFKDPRALPILITAYNKADGIDESERLEHANSIVPAGMRGSVKPDPFPLTGPTGFPPEFVVGVRSKVIDALAKTNRPEAVKFLAEVATGQNRPEMEAEDQKVRVAAVRGLGHMRHKESVVALAQVLKTEGKRDLVMASRAHEGLIELTGKNLPADGEKWDKVVQAGIVVQPEQNAIQRAISSTVGSIIP